MTRKWGVTSTCQLSKINYTSCQLRFPINHLLDQTSSYSAIPSPSWGQKLVLDRAVRWFLFLRRFLVVVSCDGRISCEVSKEPVGGIIINFPPS